MGLSALIHVTVYSRLLAYLQLASQSSILNQHTPVYVVTQMAIGLRDLMHPHTYYSTCMYVRTYVHVHMHVCMHALLTQNPGFSYVASNKPGRCLEYWLHVILVSVWTSCAGNILPSPSERAG